ncbi:hypothetical protein EVAR_82609_1 [Eumeta japonica]|uniref:Uncharacterized protein n=1 Tax=Eumeta variegata TaxID=151549 RepID=A0A4C1X4Q9_EUMVA|nr:hypothetical protein EVAR_82609_1 [Eumeta japonica]
MENNPDRFSVIARSRKQVARPHASRARCDPPISARRSPSSRHLAPINAHPHPCPAYVRSQLRASEAVRRFRVGVQPRNQQGRPAADALRYSSLRYYYFVSWTESLKSFEATISKTHQNSGIEIGG